MPKTRGKIVVEPVYDLLDPFARLWDVFQLAGLDLWDWMTDRLYEPLAGINGVVWIRRKVLRRWWP